MNDVAIRPYSPGDAGYVAYIQMKFYQMHYAFNEIFEYYLLASLAEFVKSGDGNRLWVAECGGTIIGSIAIVKTQDYTAQLRWFYVDARFQGKGIGQRLMDTAMQFCREQRYRHIFLWTARPLDAAKHLYEKYGFTKTAEKVNNEWTDDPLTEERMDMDMFGDHVGA